MNTNKINGLVQMLLSLGFFYYHADTLYSYKFIFALYSFMYPDWVLIINIILGIFGFIIGLNTFKGIMKIWRGYLWVLSILLFGLLLDIISVGWL